MKIHVCITPAHKILLDSVFLPSLPAGWDPVIHQIELTGPGDYLSEEFLQCIRRKTQLIVESLEDRSGDLVVWSDVDVCFYARDGNRLAMDMERMPEHHITFLNIFQMESELPHSTCEVGDGRRMPQFTDGQFDLVISNSVIEHVGNSREQRRFAEEIQRVGPRYFVQTPNRRFPLEPHFLLPLFQYFPLTVRAFLHQHFDFGWWKKAGTYLSALEEVESIRLLSDRN